MVLSNNNNNNKNNNNTTTNSHQQHHHQANSSGNLCKSSSSSFNTMKSTTMTKSYSTVVKSNENRVPVSAGGLNISLLNASSNGGSSLLQSGPTIMSDEDKKINLNALKNQDPFATNILDAAQRVAVYRFIAKKNEWKKLDVEGSFFLFERIVEPIHSFVVMNTLALNLFLQPITYDLEFQDRNPFLLYKSNNDVYGIWFIDKEDCDRIKNLITKLTDNAKERRSQREQNKQATTSSNGGMTAVGQQVASSASTTSTVSSVAAAAPPSTSISLQQLLSSSSTSGDNKKNNSDQVDIMQMLNKAHQQYKQQQTGTSTSSSGGLIAEPTSHSTPSNAGTSNLMSSLAAAACVSSTSSGVSHHHHPSDLFSSSSNILSALEPKPIAQWSQSGGLALSSAVLKPEPTKTTSSSNSILQLLLNSNHSESSSSMIGQASSTSNMQDLTQELKRKLNIQSSTSLAPGLSTPQHPNSAASLLLADDQSIVNSVSVGQLSGFGTGSKPFILSVKDFEENLLSSQPMLSAGTATSTPDTLFTSQAGQKSTSSIATNTNIQPVFYLPPMTTTTNTTTDSSNNTTTSEPGHTGYEDYNATSTKLNMLLRRTMSTEDDEQPLSSTDTSSTSNSSSSRNDSDIESCVESSPQAVNNQQLIMMLSQMKDGSSAGGETPTATNVGSNLPLLMTPAAFETSSISSTASSASNHNINETENTTTSNLLENFLFPQAASGNATVAKTNATNKQNKKNTDAASNVLLNKTQLQSALIHLLNTDDKFVSSLHQAYMKSHTSATGGNTSQVAKSANTKKNEKNGQQQMNNKTNKPHHSYHHHHSAAYHQNNGSPHVSNKHHNGNGGLNKSNNKMKNSQSFMHPAASSSNGSARPTGITASSSTTAATSSSRK